MAFKFPDTLLCPSLVKPNIEPWGLVKPQDGSSLLCSGFLVKPRFQKDDPVPPKQRELEVASWVGVIRDIQDGEVIPAQWGVRPTVAGITSLRSGTIVGMTLTLDDPPTAGSLDANVLINGIAQNGTGQTFNFAGQVGFFEYPVPIPISAGDVIDVCVEAGGGFAPSGTNGTLTVYYTQTGFLIPAAECDVTSTISWVGNVRNLEASERAGAQWSGRPANGGITALVSGTLRGLTVTLDTPITAGTISSNVLINGISQNAAGQTLVGTTQTQTLVFGTPILFSAGDVIDFCAEASAAMTPSTNLTVAVWYRTDS